MIYIQGRSRVWIIPVKMYIMDKNLKMKFRTSFQEMKVNYRSAKITTETLPIYTKRDGGEGGAQNV